MSRVFQNLIMQIKNLYGRQLGTIDAAGTVIACTTGLISAETVNYVLNEYTDPSAFYSYEGITYKPVGNRNKVDFIAFCEGIDEVSRTCCSVLAIALSNIKALHDEKHDKTNLIKNILQDSVLPTDIIAKCKELHIEIDVARVVFCIKLSQPHPNNQVVFEVLQNMFHEKDKNFVINVDETTLVLVKEVKESITAKELDAIAKTIVDTISTEAMAKVTVGIGGIRNNIRDIANSFREANVALDVSKVFGADKSIISYESLGIGRLIYQLPTTLCELFLSEVFKKGTIDELDAETILTVQKFFQYNLNVSETAREMFVHRNTLVYRLDKVEKVTGLDLREFDKAVVFKVAMMVRQYLQSNIIKF